MTDANTTILSVQGLTKTYTSFKKQAGLRAGLKQLFVREKTLIPAVKQLDFSINRGEFVGLLGPNGAGKTTTLKMLTGLIAPTQGSATAFGSYNTARRDARYLRRIGMVMGQRNQLNPDLPALDSFRLAQAIYRLPEHSFQRRLKECLDLFAIHDKAVVPVRKLSLGERMKMELTLAILHEPELLFLDEPTIGLDFHAARQVRSFLAEANRQLGITVVLTSHYTKDIQELCRRVILINHGSIVYDGSLTQMDARLQDQRQVSILLNNAQAQHQAQAFLQKESYQTTTSEQTTPGSEKADFLVNFGVTATEMAAALAKLIAYLGADNIRDLKVHDRELEEIFAELYSSKTIKNAMSANTL